MLFMWAHVLGSEDGHEAEAITLLEEVLSLVRGRVLSSELHPSALADLGDLWLRMGDREHGVALVVEALNMYRTTANQFGIGQTLHWLGRLDRDEGVTRSAARRFGESLRAFRSSGIMTQAGFLLGDLGELVADCGFPGTAARLAGMMQAIADRTGAVFAGGSTGDVQSGQGKTTSQDDRAAFEAGRALPFDEAIGEAIAIAEALAAGNPPPGGARHRLSHAPALLSSRERDVLGLLAQRYTAPEIADQLFLSVRTVERHVSNVYNKLGVNSRSAAVAAANQHGLV
jgi:DNA-binding CsgD family transcriptional regulator